MAYLKKKALERISTNNQKMVTKVEIQKGIKNIVKLVELNKSNKADYLTICSLVRKIYASFDFDGDHNLDKIEVQALINTLTREMLASDTSLNVTALRHEFKGLIDRNERITERMITDVIC